MMSGMKSNTPLNDFAPESFENSGQAPLRCALIGFGNAGRNFHAPVIAAVPGITLAGIVSSQTAAVKAAWPGVPVLATPAQAFADPAIELVIIASPNDSHHALARAALLAGKHVLVDKPCTVTLAETDDLLALAQAQGRVLTVYQSRRFDADFLSLKQVLATGQLGRLVQFESRYDRFKPQVLDRWRDNDVPGAGLWLDLGSHLLDQCLVLLGVPDAMMLDLAAQRDGAQVHDCFHAQLRYDSLQPGLRAVLHAGSLVPAGSPRFAVHGTQGSFIKHGMDSQEDALKAGRRPQLAALAGWGLDPQPGEVITWEDGQRVSRPAPEARGCYPALYAQLRDCLLARRGGLPADAAVLPAPPVSALEVRQLMALLSRGEQSAREGRWVPCADLRA
jgi:predicted dehydrogenase